MTGETVYLLCGVWALVVLAIFIQAVRLSYRIEARSPGLTNRSGFPRNARPSAPHGAQRPLVERPAL
ncbi:hypothetical protein [Mesorhizobium sp.]|uniref:hypothetical protein n=1 Tax=Mesorhizobium sp. TaxID=1871066 RepID=UPI000FE5C99A|nr:hypothetical protein [Mesorhizobium sp.]RWO58804.1 MAG: hypothetical protein EOS14_19175 [Mesorhizobium sp.]